VSQASEAYYIMIFNEQLLVILAPLYNIQWHDVAQAVQNYPLK